MTLSMVKGLFSMALSKCVRLLVYVCMYLWFNLLFAWIFNQFKLRTEFQCTHNCQFRVQIADNATKTFAFMFIYSVLYTLFNGYVFKKQEMSCLAIAYRMLFSWIVSQCTWQAMISYKSPSIPLYAQLDGSELHHKGTIILIFPVF